MRFASIFRLRIRSIFSRTKVEQELEEELRYHLERQIDENVAGGLSGEQARHAALRSIEGFEQRKEECRDMRRLNLMDNAAQDFRYALGQLRTNPGFACTAILVLALGISATAAIFGFVDAALIKPLPFRDQSRLVAAFESSPGNPRSIVSYLDFTDWKRLNHVFSSIDAYALNGGFTLKTATGAEQVPGTRVSAGFFRTLGVVPSFGRDFRAGEDSPGARSHGDTRLRSMAKTIRRQRRCVGTHRHPQRRANRHYRRASARFSICSLWRRRVLGDSSGFRWV